MLYIELIKFLFFSGLIVLISKFLLVSALRRLAEALDLKAQTVGDVSGLATSVPELLTITTAALRGLAGASIFNILSSNIINFVLYLTSIILNKNGMKLKNKAIKIDMAIVTVTILIPIALLQTNTEISIVMVPIFIALYFFLRFINNNAHKLFLKEEDKKIEAEIEEERKIQNKNKKRAIGSVFVLLLAGIALFIIGELLGTTLENLCNHFYVPEVLIGIMLGMITSIPELITFFESQKHGNKNNNSMVGVIEATNNLLQSNMFNLFIIQSIGIVLLNILK